MTLLVAVLLVVVVESIVLGVDYVVLVLAALVLLVYY